MEDSNCDNVLLEYLLALELSIRGMTEKIYPILVGDLVERDSEWTYENYFSTSCQPSLPDEEHSVEVKSVTQKCAMALSRLGLGTPLLSQMTVSRVFYMLIGNQGKVVVGKAEKAFEPIIHDAAIMVKLLKKSTKGPKRSSITFDKVKKDEMNTYISGTHAEAKIEDANISTGI
jgi:hypothetical protein